MSDVTAEPRFVVCIESADCKDLQLRRLSRVVPDVDGELHGLVRVVDDSGEDYLCPAARFLPVPFPEAVVHALAATA